MAGHNGAIPDRYAALVKRKARKESGLFLAEGRRLVEEGLKSECPCELVFVREGFFGKFPETDALLSSAKTQVLSARDFDKLADTEQPQGLIGVFSGTGLLDDAPTHPWLPALFDVADPRNMGTIVRSADWFGFGQIMLGESCVDPFSQKAVRSSMGSVFRTRFVLCEDLEAQLASYKGRYRILVADLDGSDYRSFKGGPPSMCVFSNEAHGPSEGIRALADGIATIPGHGGAESLSVAVAAAVFMAALR